MEYEKAFERHRLKTAQILLTSEDLSSRKRYLNARNTLNTLLDWKIAPVINENDTVSVDEIKLGDNDHLAAMIYAVIYATCSSFGATSTACSPGTRAPSPTP